MTSLLPAVLPVGLIILIGFIVGRTLSLERSTLSQLTLYVLSPALVVDSLYRSQLSVLNSFKLLLGFAVISCIIYSLSWIVSKFFGWDGVLTRAITAVVLFPNTGNMGLPVATFALGSAGLERAIVYLLGSSVLMFCFGPAIIQGKGIKSGLKLTLRLPLFWAIILGLSLRVLGITLPWGLDKGIRQLGAAAIPVDLVLLGMQLAATRFQFGIKELLTATARLAIAPIIAYLVGNCLRLETLDLQVLMLQSAMPTAVSSLVLVSEFGGDKNLVARAIVTSTLMSFITLPVWLSFLTLLH
ncbi:auxin efflux carrier [Chondrocystis sp. NIES-4102]|nr:auxin efflux carrier [Chondrocystis sp. NIES-4102]